MGPNHFTLKDGGASCGICGTKNPLGNLRRMSIQEVTEPSEIIVCFTQSGTRAGQQSRPIATQSKEPAEDRLGKAIAGSQKIVFSGSASVNKPVHAL
jgi:hypothetical protein